jgi:hypothetical protein
MEREGSGEEKAKGRGRDAEGKERGIGMEGMGTWVG